ncbi:MAG: hypothetical protein C0474_08900 [Sphingobium sp.]|nr:hypothetical protein [Sphingobium sp.]
MHWAEMVVAIVLIVTVGRVLQARQRATRVIHPAEDTPEAARLREEVRALKERIAVLERLATDDNSNSARLDREIERLRDRS